MTHREGQAEVPSRPTLLVTLARLRGRFDRAAPSSPAASPGIPEAGTSPVPVSDGSLGRDPLQSSGLGPRSPHPRATGTRVPPPIPAAPASHGLQPPASDPPEHPPLFVLPPRPGLLTETLRLLQSRRLLAANPSASTPPPPGSGHRSPQPIRSQ